MSCMKATVTTGIVEAGMRRITSILAILCAALCLQPGRALAWGAQGHEVVGDIAAKLIADNANATKQVHDILNDPLPSDAEIKAMKDRHVWRQIGLQQAGPWADCVKAVAHHDGNRFKYELDPNHPEYETACIPFNSALERARMEDYVSRNWHSETCSYQPSGFEQGCHNTFHFDDVAIQRDAFDRSEVGTNPHDLVAAVNAALAVLTDKPAPAPFSIRDKKEALLLLTHFVGDLHQPLHVGAVYLDAQGVLVDPDAARQDNPDNQTAGGNLIQDQNVNLHAEWDDIPFDIGHAATRELLAAARAVPASSGPLENWAGDWATDTLQVAKTAFQGLSFAQTDPPPHPKWAVIFPDRLTYMHLADEIKRQQLAKAGARLAQILNTIWPKN